MDAELGRITGTATSTDGRAYTRRLSTETKASYKTTELDADLPLGVDPETIYRVQPLQLEPEDRLVLLSDGVLEAAPEGAAAYGASRLEQLLRASRELAPHEVTRLVVDEVIAHRAGDLADDLTVVCLDWRGPAS